MTSVPTLNTALFLRLVNAGNDLFADAPSDVHPPQLEEYFVQLAPLK